MEAIEKKPEQPIVKYSLTDGAISKMENEYLHLAINGVDDKGGFNSVHVARMDVRGHRVAVEHRRKELKADALRWEREVDAEAKRLTGRLTPIEDHLKSEEDRINAEKARIKAEAVRVEEERVQARVDALVAVGAHIPFAMAKALTDEEFETRLQIETERHGIEQTRLAKEAEERKTQAEAERKALAEAEERLAEFRKVQEAEAKRLEEAARKLNEDRMRQEREQALAQSKLETDRRALDEEKRIEAAKKETADRLHQEALQRHKEQAEREHWEEEEKARQEALRPDKEKMIAYGKALLAVPRPELTSQEAEVQMVGICAMLDELYLRIEQITEDI